MDKQIQMMFELIRLPKNHWDVNMSGGNEGVHKKILFDWLTNTKERLSEKRGPLFIGKYGTGKSACAAVVLKAAVAHGVFGLWIYCREFKGLNSFKKMFDDDTTLLERAYEVPILVLDDLIIGGRTSKGERVHEEEVLEDLIRGRVADCKMTVVTTNMKFNKIEELNHGLAAILSEACHIVPVEGRDLRKDN